MLSDVSCVIVIDEVTELVKVTKIVRSQSCCYFFIMPNIGGGQTCPIFGSSLLALFNSIPMFDL